MRPALGTFALLLSLPLAALPLAAGSAGASPDGPGAGGERARASGDLVWHETVVDADQGFRGLDAVDRRTVWVSGGSVSEGGSGGVHLTTDGGATWQHVSPPAGAGLMFRDVEAVDARVAHVLAIGPGEASRIYRTVDGGTTWTETFRNAEPEAFYNCMDFFPGGRHGLAVSDPVDGRFRIAATDDGGRTWQTLPDDGMPDSTGEYNFSASGDCLVVRGHDAWFGSGGTAARVFHSRDHGRTWRADATPLPTGEAAGVFALAFRTPRHGVVVGGDFAAPATGAVAATRDARSWHAAGDLGHLGEDAAWLRGGPRTLLVVGQSGPVGGSSISHDGGRTWEQIEQTGFHTLDCTADGACWAAGGGGRVAFLGGA